jgi:hypothetical protein
MPRPVSNPGKYPVPIVQEAGWTPGPIWTGTENLALTGIRSPDRPAHSQSLYRLSYQTRKEISGLLFDSIVILVLKVSGSYSLFFKRGIHTQTCTGVSACGTPYVYGGTGEGLYPRTSVIPWKFH